MTRYPGRHRNFNLPALGSTFLIGGFLATEASVWIVYDYWLTEYDWDEYGFLGLPDGCGNQKFLFDLWLINWDHQERVENHRRMFDLHQGATFAIQAKGYVHENYVKREFWKYKWHYELWKYFAQFRGEEGYSEGEIW